MKRNIVLKAMVFGLIAVSTLMTGCTDLEEQVLDEVQPVSISEVNGAEESLLAASYSYWKDLYCNYSGIWCMNQMTTDETVLPGRGEDWWDGGSWAVLNTATWNPSSRRVENVWNKLNQAVSSVDMTIDLLKTSDVNNQSALMAESKVLWALYTYNVVDLFGQVPYRDPLNVDFGSSPEILDSKAALEKCLAFLTEEVIADLTSFQAGTSPGRITKEAAYALRAQIYLNMAVYDDRYNESSSFEYKKEYMDQVIADCDRIINSGKFSLEANFFEILGVDNYCNSEHILSVIQSNEGADPGKNAFTYLSMGRIQKANPEDNRGSNATCITPEYYHTWDGNHNDPRFHSYTKKNGGEIYRNDGTDTSLPYDGIFHYNCGFQEGPQYGPLIQNGAFIMDDSDPTRVMVLPYYCEKNTSVALDFTVELDFPDPTIPKFNQSQINQGVRVFKQEYDAVNTRKKGGVDMPIFRLGQIYTMRAEAKFRNGDVDGARADINILRTSRYAIDINGDEYYGEAIPSLDEETLYNEISYEMYWEGVRRREMIRFGTFDEAYTAKAQTAPYRRVFSIPQKEIDINKDLQQNMGY